LRFGTKAGPLAVALTLGWLGLTPRVGLACGPFFPNWMLAQGDSAVLASPETVFSKALERLLPPPTTTLADSAGYEPQRTLQAEVADLKEALNKAGVAAGQRDAIVARHLAERGKIGVFAPFDKETTLDAESGPFWGGKAFMLRPNPTNNTRIQGVMPQITPGLPGEFADYFQGSVAWHLGNFSAARSAWLNLLGRPPAERHFKSTWAAFMLGRSWEEENRSRAMGYFQKVRDLARHGFADSLGLAVASLGWEARLDWREGRSVEAIGLYLEQAAAGDPSAEGSLRFVASAALERAAPALGPLARDARARAVVTAYIVSGGYRKAPIDVDGTLKEAGLQAWEKASARFTRLPAPKANWHTLSRPVLLWLEAVEGAGVKNLESAELLALAAYQAGEIETARRWLGRAQPSLLTQWLQAKLLLRDGQVDEAAALLTKVCRHFPLEPPGTNAQTGGRLQDTLVAYANPYFDRSGMASAAEQTRAELAVFRLARRQFVEALDLFLHSSPDYWMDAAYVGERVLTLDELKGYVDRQWPPEPPSAARPKQNGAEAELSEQGAAAPNRSAPPGQLIRYLLARRLARAWRFIEARPYYPPDWQPCFDQFLATWREAERMDRPQMERALVLLEAAFLARKHGLELMGTEVEPDWRIHAGNFEEGVTVASRVGLQVSNHLTASTEEVERATQHAATPEQRWHYRRTAAAIAWEAAWMMRNAQSPGQPPEERARAMFEAAQTLRHSSISPDGLDLRAVKDFDFVRAAAPSEASLASRLSGQTSNFFALPVNTMTMTLPGAMTNRPSPDILWRRGYTTAALAWEATQLLPNNSDETARVLCLGGRWIDWDPPVADLFYKALVRRCRKTAMGAEADRIRWFPRLDATGHLLPRDQQPLSPSERKEQK
jgi:hypothetical protein